MFKNLLKNRAIQVKLVDVTPEANETVSTPVAPIDYDKIINVAAKRLVVGTVVVIAATVTLTTLSKIAVEKLS